jgi:hypothetical protein
MRKTVAALLAAAGLALALSGPVAAHTGTGDPCAETAPGHSAYAMHHIVVLAQAGALGAGGHLPGEHQGYAGLCGVFTE